jgi:hypothetical protein
MDKEEIKEIGEELEEFKEEESEIKKGLRKIYIIIMALFLAFLILGNSLVGSFLVSLFSGKISSVAITDNIIKFDNRTLYFEPTIYDRLKQYYNENQKSEIKLCMTGVITGNKYYITGMYSPVTYKKDVFSVTSQMCNADTVIDLHTHPYLHCIFSNQDITSYTSYHKYNPGAIMALMCEEDRFSLYG